MNKKLIFFVLGALTSITVWGQSVEMGDTMRSNGKIYVVVGVILIIFIGLVVYLMRLDRKITGIEKEQKDKNEE